MRLLLIIALLAAVGCASKPKLYPNEKFEAVGPTAAQADIDNCIAKADAYLEGEKGKQMAKGAGTGAVMGGVVGVLFGGGIRGAARGAAAGGIIGGTGAALSPEQMKRQYVNTCLGKMGYQVLGWD
jgi:uncharacterized protein YcfJ